MRLQKRTIRQKLAGIQAVNRIGMGKDRIYTENVDNPKTSLSFCRYCRLRYICP